MNVPVVLFVYKRPTLTRQLVEILRRVQIKTFFVFGDGPRCADEESLCRETKEIFTNIDWAENVHLVFSDTNLGLGNRVISGLNHVFSMVDRAIVLEDDCMPHENFWMFCETMLERYNSCENIMHIGGTNLLHQYTAGIEESYFFSRHALPCWGWASWARAWQKFNTKFNTWEKKSEQLVKILKRENRKICSSVFDTLAKGNIDSWDVQWMIDIWENAGAVVMPKSNLVSNIGTGEGASYMPEQTQFARIITNSLAKELIHPQTTECFFDKLYEDKLVELMKDFMQHNKNKSLAEIKSPNWVK